MSKKTYDYISFIEELFIPNLEEMIGDGYQYYAFPILCQAIEVMGAFYDQLPLSAPKQSANRFKRALEKLFRTKYYNEKKHDFFTALRGNMIHQLRPGSFFLLTSNKFDKTPKKEHLNKQDNDQTVIVIECFFEDFKKAFERFKKDVSGKKGEIDKSKVELEFLRIFPLKEISIDKGISSLSPIVSGGCE